MQVAYRAFQYSTGDLISRTDLQSLKGIFFWGAFFLPSFTFKTFSQVKPVALQFIKCQMAQFSVQM